MISKPADHIRNDLETVQEKHIKNQVKIQNDLYFNLYPITYVNNCPLVSEFTTLPFVEMMFFFSNHY